MLIMVNPKALTTPVTEDAHADDPPRSPQKARKNYRQLNNMHAPNRPSEEITAEKAEKEQCQRDKVTKKQKMTTNLAQFEDNVVNDLLEKGCRAAHPPPQVKAKRAVAQASTTVKPMGTSTSNRAKVR